MNIELLTEGTVDGQGVFDLLMQSAKSHLNAEYEKNRFSGEDYAKAYTNITTIVMQQATQYLLSAPQSEAQVALINAQKEKTLVDTSLVTVQKANATLEGANILKQGLRFDKELELADLQKAKLIKDTALTTEQTSNVIAEGVNIPLQGTQITAQTAGIQAETIRTTKGTLQLEQQTVNLVTENANAVKQGAILTKEIERATTQITQMTAQTAQVTEQTSLIQQQGINLAAEKLNIPKQGLVLDKQVTKLTEDILASTTGRAQTVAQTDLVGKQSLKTTQETLLVTSGIAKSDTEATVLEQRRKSEEAQIRDTVDGITVTGILGQQKSLYLAQTEGFHRNAEHKVMKTMADIWAVQRTTDNSLQSIPAGLGDADIAQSVAGAFAGVGLSPPNTVIP